MLSKYTYTVPAVSSSEKIINRWPPLRESVAHYSHASGRLPTACFFPYPHSHTRVYTGVCVCVWFLGTFTCFSRYSVSYFFSESERRKYFFMCYHKNTSRVVHTIVIIINTRYVAGERDRQECAGISPIDGRSPTLCRTACSGCSRPINDCACHSCDQTSANCTKFAVKKKKPLQTCIVRILNVIRTNPLNKH